MAFEILLAADAERELDALRSYESSAEPLERGRRAREQYTRGEVKSLEQIKQEHSRKQAREA
jgi:hypothetical protein